MYFEIILVSPQARGLKDGRTEVKVKMRSLVDDSSCLFGRNNFLDRKYRMQEMYQDYIEGGKWDIQGVGQWVGLVFIFCPVQSFYLAKKKRF